MIRYIGIPSSTSASVSSIVPSRARVNLCSDASCTWIASSSSRAELDLDALCTYHRSVSIFSLIFRFVGINKHPIWISCAHQLEVLIMPCSTASRVAIFAWPMSWGDDSSLIYTDGLVHEIVDCVMACAFVISIASSKTERFEVFGIDLAARIPSSIHNLPAAIRHLVEPMSQSFSKSDMGDPRLPFGGTKSILTFATACCVDSIGSCAEKTELPTTSLTRFRPFVTPLIRSTATRSLDTYE